MVEKWFYETYFWKILEYSDLWIFMNVIEDRVRWLWVVVTWEEARASVSIYSIVYPPLPPLVKYG